MLCKFQRWIRWLCWIVFVATVRTRGLLSGCCSTLHGKRLPITITIETIGICIVVCICSVFLCICLHCKCIFPTGLQMITYSFLFCILLIVCFYPQIGVGLSFSLPPSFDPTYANTATKQSTNDDASPGGRVSINHRPQSRRVCRHFCCSGSFCELNFF